MEDHFLAPKKQTKLTPKSGHSKLTGNRPNHILDASHASCPTFLAVFAGMAAAYVDSIQRGGIPSVETAIETLARKENTAAIQSALNVYVSQMEQELRLPTQDEKTLDEVHFQCLQNSLMHFQDRSFLDEDGVYKVELTVSIACITLLRQNHHISTGFYLNLSRLQQTLKDQWKSIRDVSTQEWLCLGIHFFPPHRIMYDGMNLACPKQAM